MHKNVFAYIAFNLLLINLIGLDSALLQNIISLICIAGVMTVGLAHGAIDNLLAVGLDQTRQLRFIIKYLLAALGFILLWILFPNFTFVCFLLISGYHFGQSQFVEYELKNPLLKWALFLCWGLLILFLSFAFNQDQLLTFSQNWLSSVSIFPWLIERSIHISGIFGSIVFALLFNTLLKKNIKMCDVFQELYLLALISVSFYLFDTVVGFSLFFLFIHSLKVIQQEFEYCKTKMSITSLYSFIKLFIPLTFASIFGISSVIAVCYYFGGEQLIPYILIVMLSSFTIPHSFVMDKFYS